MLRPSLVLAGLLAVLSSLPVAHAGQPADAALFSAEGYRIDRYRSPTPAAVEGAQTLDTVALQQLLAGNPAPVLIDVMRQPWLQGRFVASEEHRNIPGSLWLANIGDGALDSRWQGYLESNLQQITAGDHSRALVFYCKSDCWLSWNAARRAMTLGYTSVYWYRDGVDAWQAAGLPLQTASPVPLP